MAESTFYSPAYGAKDFNCARCGVYAHQNWYPAEAHGWIPVEGFAFSHCAHCGQFSLWLNEDMIVPDEGGAPRPHNDMPDEVRDDYDEARSILARSPRGAAALLRLAVQKLCKALGENGENLNTDIGALVAKGLPVGVQQALDGLRVIGNNAVHPGQITLIDDSGTATALFGLINFIVDKMIAEPKEIERIYGLLPPTALAQIQRRDALKE